MKGILWFIIGALLFVFMIVTVVITIKGLGKRKKLIENAVTKFKVKDTTAKTNLVLALVFLMQLPLSLFRAFRDFREFNTFGGWGEILFSASIVIMFILDIILYRKAGTAYITDEGLIASEKMFSKNDLKYILFPNSIEFYYKNNPKPLKLQMLENKEELIDMLTKNFNKYEGESL